MKKSIVVFLVLFLTILFDLSAGGSRDYKREISDLEKELSASEERNKVIGESLIKQYQSVNVTVGAIITQSDFVSGDYYIMDADVFKGIVAQSGYSIVTDYNPNTKKARISSDSYRFDNVDLKPKIEIYKEGPQVSWSSNTEIAGGVDINPPTVSVNADGVYDKLYMHNIEKIAEISFNSEARDNESWMDNVIERYLTTINIFLLKNSYSIIPPELFEFAKQFPMIESAVLYKTEYQQCTSTKLDANISVGEIVSLNGKYYQKQGSSIIKNYIKIGLVDPAGLWPNISDRWTNAVAKQWQNTKRIEALFVNISEADKELILENYKSMPNEMKTQESEEFIKRIDPTYQGINLSEQVANSIRSSLSSSNQILFDEMIAKRIIDINDFNITLNQSKYLEYFEENQNLLSSTVLPRLPLEKSLDKSTLNNAFFNSIQLELNR